jgi:DUF4097 and DUF4098 domain-containing protein YvlB
VTSNGAAALTVCGSTLKSSLTVQNTTGPVEVGAGTGCAPNSITGSVTLSSNRGGMQLVGNHIGGKVGVTGNSGMPEVIASNTIGGTLACSGNTPAPSDGPANTVTGSRSGQCGASGF